MTTHYPRDYRTGDILVQVDNRTATKVSVWYDGEPTPRKRFAGDDAYGDALNFAFRLEYSMGYEAPTITNESVALALGGIPADDDSDY
jgi:hypothetical protein